MSTKENTNLSLTLPVAADEENAYICVSNAHTDKDWKRVYPILFYLYKAGYNIWYDDGSRGDETEERIEGCAAFMIFVSRYSKKPEYDQNGELAKAKECDKRILAYYLDDVNDLPSDIINVIDEYFDDCESVKRKLSAMDIPRYDRRESDPIPGLPRFDCNEEPFAYVGIHSDDSDECPNELKWLWDAGYNMRSFEYSRDHDKAVAMAKCSAFMPVLTKRYVESGMFGDDAELARLLGKPFIVLQMDKDVPLPDELSPTYYEDSEEDDDEYRSSRRKSSRSKKHDDDRDSYYAPEQYSEFEVLSPDDADESDKTDPSGTETFRDRIEDLLRYYACYNLNENGELRRRAFSIPDFYFEKTKDDRLILTEYYGTKTKVKIDPKYNGMPVYALKGTFDNTDRSREANYDSLEMVTLPEGLAYIGENTFRGCNKLHMIVSDRNTDEYVSTDSNQHTITLPKSVRHIGKQAFAECDTFRKVVIPEGVESIGEGAFQNCTGLSSAVLPGTLKQIGNNAFDTCRTLRSVFFGGNRSDDEMSSSELVSTSELVSIGDKAFASCARLYEIELPSGLESIGKDAFSGCSELGTGFGGYGFKTFVIPDTVTTVGSKAFQNCKKLSRVIMSSGLKEIPDGMFQKCVSLIDPEIPEGTLSIGNSAFNKCESITQMVIPNSVESIEDWAFSNCRNLKTVDIRGSVETIGEAAFSNCSILNNVVIPNTVASIGDSAFDECKALDTITINGLNTVIGNGAFADCSSDLVVSCHMDSKAWSFCNDNQIRCEKIKNDEDDSGSGGIIDDRHSAGWIVFFVLLAIAAAVQISGVYDLVGLLADLIDKLLNG